MSPTAEEVMLWAHQQAVKAKSPRAAYNKFIPRRVDKNQSALVKAFRQLGIQVTHMHAVGQGVFDLLLAHRWLVVSCEIKDGEKPPSKREFTPAQKEWNARWTGLRAVACNMSDAVCIAEDMKRIVQAVASAGISPRVMGSNEDQYQP